MARDHRNRTEHLHLRGIVSDWHGGKVSDWLRLYGKGLVRRRSQLSMTATEEGEVGSEIASAGAVAALPTR